MSTEMPVDDTRPVEPIRLYTIGQAAVYLACSPNTIHYWLGKRADLFPVARYKRIGRNMSHNRVLTAKEIEALKSLMVHEVVKWPPEAREASRRRSRSLKRDRAPDSSGDEKPKV